MKPPPLPAAPARRIFDLGPNVWPGQIETAEAENFTVRLLVHPDDTADSPWLSEDGHGPVSDWRRPHTKAPGERVLSDGRHWVRFYDFAEACRIARRDGWGVAGGRQPGETERAYAARAAEADFQRLRGWCEERWSYVGVSVTVEADYGGELVTEYECALWGIESDAGEYIAEEVAPDLLAQALDLARERIASLAERVA